MDEMNNCCGTTCDKRLVITHFNDTLEINARLSSENEMLKRQVNSLNQAMAQQQFVDNLYSQMKRQGLWFFSVLLVIDLGVIAWLNL